VRRSVLGMVAAARASHVGSCLSCADILGVLYGGAMRFRAGDPEYPGRDRFIMSKGHAAAALYATLAHTGFIPVETLLEYSADGSLLLGHVNHKVPGVEFSTGSLGHGLPVGCGMALAGARGKQDWHVFVLLSDGELDEGSNWEAILFAGHHGLDNLTAIVDFNKIQSLGRVDEVLRLEPLADKWRAFGWCVLEIDGHDLPALTKSLGRESVVPGKPRVVIAHTVKGKGVRFMEDKLAWHYKSPSAEELRLALAELE
jgi:transketolase